MIRLFKGLLLPGCVLGLWQWLVMIQYVKSESLSYPSAIAVASIGVIQDGTLLVAAAQTFSGALSGWLVGATLGIVVGIAFGLSQTLSRLMKITVETVRPIPSVALIPLALLIYGYGVLLETSVVAFSCFVRKPISGRWRSWSRGAASPQCSGFGSWGHVILKCCFVTILQELVNLAPFVLDDGSIVTGECFLHGTFLASLTSNSWQAPNHLRAWS